MARDAHEAPAGRGRSSTPPATGIGMWESPPPHQMQTHAPFPSLSPYAGTFVVGGAGTTFGAAHLSPPAASDSDHHTWNQRSPSAGAHGASGDRDNFLSLLEARSVAPEMFEDVPAACDYLTSVGAATTAAGSNITGAAAAAYGALCSVDRYSAAAGAPPARHAAASPPLVYSGNSVGCAPCCGHGVGGGSQQQGFGAPTAAFLQQMVPGRVEIQSAPGYSVMGSERATESLGVGSLLDTGSFGDYRSAAEFMSSNNNRREKDKRPGMGSSSSSCGAASVATTRRQSEQRVGGNTKKSKQEASRKALLPKPQAPKVKLGEREKITALQQIVSPFGKTDTASVLLETIKYIKFLHDQLRLFSEPYMTKRGYKGHIQFGGDEKEEKTGTGHGLMGRGLCLVPVSLTSQVYHDDALPDCWTPAYRSCLYG